MTPEEINNPIILNEITAVFHQYEKALINNDLKILDKLFWHDDRTVRFGIKENLYGIEQIRNFRNTRSLKGLARTLIQTKITTFGNNYAICSTEFIQHDLKKIGRQQQTWVKMSHGWCIVAAHVSVVNC